MTTPPRGDLAATEASGLSRIQDFLNPASHSRCGLGLSCPDWLENTEDVVRRDGVDGLTTQRCSICLQRGFPLCFVLFVPEPRSKPFPYVIGHLAECWNASVALAFINRVQALGNLPACTRGFLTSIREWDPGETTKPHFFALASKSKTQHPFPGTSLGNY